ncbi:MAG: hypothetical protein HZB71_08085 [Betaproteobacteria bacterium]|nr:hypothetical protein [Betaproteobacteria bacterium]
MTLGGRGGGARRIAGDAAPALPAGDYLAWSRGDAVEAMALSDLDQPLRRLAWLRLPGLNVYWMRLDRDWSRPALQRLGGGAGTPERDVLGLRRIPGWLGAGLGRILYPLLPYPVFEHGRQQLGLGQWRALWPPARLARDDPWRDWVRFLSQLSVLRLEDITPDPAPPAPANPSAPAPGSARLGLHIHLHYLAAWPGLLAALRHFPPDARLFITVSDAAEAASGDTVEQALARMAGEAPHACIERTPNRGRDIGPFLSLLARGAFDGLDGVCKLHGKQSVCEGRPTWLGMAWARQAIHELAPSAQGVAAVGQRFLREPDLGVLGPERLRLPSPRFGLEESLENEWEQVSAVMRARWGGDRSSEIEFFAGSMFWFRPEALAALREPPPGGWSFAPEPIPGSGSLAHALERLLPTAAKLSGYRVESLPPLGRFHESG